MKAPDSPTWRRAGGALALLLAIQPCLAAGPSRAEDSAADAAYDCPAPAAAQLAAEVTRLSTASWDKNSLGCAADLLAAAAGAAPGDIALQVQALLASAAYIGHVNLLWDFDLYGVRVPEWDARIRHAIGQAQAIEQRVAAAGEDPDLLAARALYKLTWPTKIADTRTIMGESRAALALLEKAAAGNPMALGGNALWLLGRVYYDLPEFAGGDGVRAMKLLEQARAQTPENLAMLRYSAYVFAQQRDPARARARLGEMLAVAPDPTDLQSVADELRNARDLALRLGDEKLAGRLDAKRDSLFAQQPKLLTRKPTAANMHGGVDPLTGKEY